ncbi:MAG: diguanylate cyclase [Phreatobacter sp.]|nr:diguanylate cyclase [Phreatobacter sp.]
MYCEIFDTGIDERAQAPVIRRLYARWQALRAEGPAVPFSYFAPQTMGPAADDMIVFRPLPDGDMVFAHYGRALIERNGVDMTGLPHSHLKEPIGAFFRDCNAQAAATGRPLFTLHRGKSAGPVHLWERLVLPCQDETGETLLVVVAKPRLFREDLLASLLDASLDAIVAVRLIRDDQGRVTDGEFLTANRLAAEWSGLSVEAMLQTTILKLRPDLKQAGLWDAYVQAAEMRAPLQLLTPWTILGRQCWMEVACVPFGDGFTLTVTDVTEKQKALDREREAQGELARANEALKDEIHRRQDLERELSRLATRDSLTGALNRRAVTEGLQRAMATAERYGHPISVVAMDLDHFKRINDEHGHAGGDAVLRHVTDLLTHGLREDVDLVGRLGGEEFVIVLPHVGLMDAVAVASRMRAVMADTGILHDGQPIVFSGSFGVASWDGRETMDRLLSRADTALYRAKAAGRNAVAVDEGAGEIAVAVAPPEAPLQPLSEPFMPSTRQGTAPRSRRSKAGS